ncbi:PACE efflux transporter [uncultured Halomonas sp.]|uniref:PACE efflux transporter n=1 Tax=uncultured Halomonas sp. TaxID=173971 RepID=UPI00262255A8|nr:PACE efflux transporter [uncultured Halomonas sp.]
MISLPPIKRRLLYVFLFEVFGILFSTLILMTLSDGDAQQSLPVAIMVSIAAVIWNFIYNTGFEFWEFRKQIGVRTFKVRSLHAFGFEAGLFLICLPLYMVWYDVGVWTAATMEAAIMVFFLVYTFLFTLLFDRVFPRPGFDAVDCA